MTEDQLRLEYVPLNRAALWDKNPKLHDKERIKDSIRQHGFKDPPKFEPCLNDGQGGTVEGNGRLICLREMQATDDSPPRGILSIDGDWAIPILFGVDAESEAAASSYAVDHNNLTIMGSSVFGPLDAAYLYDIDGYLGVLENLSTLDSLPVSVGPDDLTFLQESMGMLDDLDSLLSGDEGEPAGETLYTIRLRTGDRELFDTVAGEVGSLVRRKGWKVELEVTS